MVTPVVLARRCPAEMAALLAFGAALNWVVAGHVVRCGVALPVILYVAFLVGEYARARLRTITGAGAVVVNLVCQAYADPELGVGVLTYIVPVALVFVGLGAFVRVRRETSANLRRKTEELSAQRDENARLAVAADRVRIASTLGALVHESIDEIVRTADKGRNQIRVSPMLARASFIEIQRSGRTALARMREVVADFDESSPTTPEPMLAQVDRLVARATEGRARLRIDGDPRLLPPGLELSGYRILERLVGAVDLGRGGAVDIVIAFHADELRLSVAGPSGQPLRLRAALAAVNERAAVHGGVLETFTDRDHRTTVVRLPLAPSHV
jgi:hypothetical protein